MQILGHSGAGREFRWGMWKKVVQPTNPNTNPTTGWLGYMALNGAGAGTGRLEAKNPDGDFQNAIFISDFGGGSIAQFSGPAPACGRPCYRMVAAIKLGNAIFCWPKMPRMEMPVLLIMSGIHSRFALVATARMKTPSSASLVADSQPAAGDFNNNGAVEMRPTMYCGAAGGRSPMKAA